MSNKITESQIENLAISLFEKKGYQYFYGPDIAPDDNFVNFFNDSVKDLFDKIFTNQEQIQSLEKLRDQLLPKLMSGGILINKSEDFGND